jgi:hypothetical protein
MSAIMMNTAIEITIKAYSIARTAFIVREPS